jgi:hypothetical protein
MHPSINRTSSLSGGQSHEMSIPNDLIGCIIGRGGQKISEIRYLIHYVIILHYNTCQNL